MNYLKTIYDIVSPVFTGTTFSLKVPESHQGDTCVIRIDDVDPTQSKEGEGLEYLSATIDIFTSDEVSLTTNLQNIRAAFISNSGRNETYLQFWTESIRITPADNYGVQGTLNFSIIVQP